MRQRAREDRQMEIKGERLEKQTEREGRHIYIGREREEIDKGR